ncbi:MAG: threonine--tRNA ligase [Actinobacteria bacterium]|nr:threonine--tRNA ligase [Actinomycetota bacterium]
MKDQQLERNITVVLPDGSEKALPEGATAADLARCIGKRLAEDAVAALMDGREVDLSTPLRDRAHAQIVTAGSEEGRYILRHSTAHVMAQAVVDLWPGAQFAIGPPVADGFYYDFALPGGARFTDEDLVLIEARMREIIAEDQPFVREELSVEEGLDLFSDQPFKQEIIRSVESSGATEPISSYRNTDHFVDLCRGPHVPSTGRLGAFKLLRVAGAYWRGDERRPQLQRIYGTAWESTKALEDHLHRLEEAERRDHRKLGQELDLFHFPTEIGGGLPVFHPKGGLVRHLLESFSKQEHLAAGYQLVWTPHIAKSTLFETSGHLQWYADGMYPPMDMEGASYYLKPMNCPMHILIYRDSARSYRELPLRLFELGTVYRFERSGVLHGLARVRSLTQDDSHIFCTPDQLEGELSSLVQFVLDILGAFGLTDFEAELSTRPEKFVGALDDWERATAALRAALDSSGIPYEVAEGEGAFYAPKLDIHLRDAIGRRWQVSTLQVDLQLPARFELSYIGPDNERHQPYMIHRALFGSVERFFAILLEHYAGALPTWLSPVQVCVLPVRDSHEPYGFQVAARLEQAQLRVELYPADEPLGARIRKAKLAKVPWVLVVGDEDLSKGTVGVNRRGSDRPERNVVLEEVVSRIAFEVDQHK